MADRSSIVNRRRLLEFIGNGAEDGMGIFLSSGRGGPWRANPDEGHRDFGAMASDAMLDVAVVKAEIVLAGRSEPDEFVNQFAEGGAVWFYQQTAASF